MSVIVKLSDGTRIKVRGVSTPAELMLLCEKLFSATRTNQRDSAHTLDVCTGKDMGKNTKKDARYDDWYSVYIEETRRGLGSSKGRHNEPTGKAKPRRLANSRRWRGFGKDMWE